ncbi:hypothetical protein DVK44_34905 [Streptomyces paludis]|uniref:Lipoprotein n=1 Tax=Streptomyces paludis TaxID=2282738 RepID=A0A345HZE3_9ACTN|nr:hypothetical protein DVK44_34905 [Streptomyces paludis]
MLVCAVALALGGCGVVSTKSDRQLAEKAAGEHYPGLLDVVAARTLFPAAAGSEITFSLADDPDAAVTLRVDAEAGGCGGEECGARLAEAIAAGRQRAEALRAMRAAFAGCGYEVVGVRPGGGTWTPWVVAEPANATVTRILADLGTCVAAWAPDATGSVSVHIAAPEAAAALPAGNTALPTVLRLSGGELLAALAGRPYYTASYTVRDGRADPRSGRAYLSRPYADGRAFDSTVTEAVGAWLRSVEPSAEPGTASGIWWLKPGTVDRMTGHVTFCDAPRADGRRCAGDHAVALTVDPRGNPVGEPRIIRDVRGPDGTLRLPEEP